jgi:hypothetical protein
MNLRRLAFVFLLAGCESGAPTDSFSTAPGSSVLVGDVTQVTFTSRGGGLHSNPPPGAACDPAQWSYTIGFADRTLSSITCTLSGDWTVSANYTPVTLLVPVDPPQWQTVRAALEAVTVSSQRTCGADADTRDLTVVRGEATLTYGDDFYGCLTSYSAFVTSDSLGNLWSVVSAIN